MGLALYLSRVRSSGVLGHAVRSNMLPPTVRPPVRESIDRACAQFRKRLRDSLLIGALCLSQIATWPFRRRVVLKNLDTPLSLPAQISCRAEKQPQAVPPDPPANSHGSTGGLRPQAPS